MVIQARKRLVVALVVAMFVAWFAISLSAQHIELRCKDLSPADWEWWFRSCYLLAHSDGDPARATGFIVR
jgi:hypothetical protein